jgi:hypothetical protein
MRKTAFVVLVALAVLAAVSCQDNLTGPSATSHTPVLATSQKPEVGTSIEVGTLMGTWQATKAEAWRMVANQGGGFVEVAGSRRDLVAQGGTVTLVLEPNSQVLGRAIPDGKYTITVTMPGTEPGVDTGFWHFGEPWGKPQIDFYLGSLLPEPEYGELPAFLMALSDNNTLTLWDGGLTFLPYDFGWNKWETGLAFEFARK